MEELNVSVTIAAWFSAERVKGPCPLFLYILTCTVCLRFCGEDHPTGPRAMDTLNLPRATTDLENRNAVSAAGEGEGGIESDTAGRRGRDISR